MLRPDWPALGSVQYTIQKFYRINGGSTQRKGVTPDIMMPTGSEDRETRAVSSMKITRCRGIASMRRPT